MVVLRELAKVVVTLDQILPVCPFDQAMSLFKIDSEIFKTVVKLDIETFCIYTFWLNIHFYTHFE